MWNPKISFRPHSDSSLKLNLACNLPSLNKRKYEPDFAEFPPAKMLITEEKMVSQLKGIHLSKDYTPHGNPGPSNVDVELDEHIKLVHKSSLPSLILSDEIKELPKCVESPLEICLKRPSTALVLWKPPSHDLQKYLMSLHNSIKEEPNKENIQAEELSESDVEMVEDDNNNGVAQNFIDIFNRTV